MNKEEQKKLLIGIMEADEKDGLYKTKNMVQQKIKKIHKFLLWLENYRIKLMERAGRP